MASVKGINSLEFGPCTSQATASTQTPQSEDPTHSEAVVPVCLAFSGNVDEVEIGAFAVPKQSGQNVEVDYSKYETRNMICLSVYFAIYFAFRAGTLVVFPLASKLLLDELLDGAPNSPLYQLPLATWFLGDMLYAAPNAIFMQRYGRRNGFMAGAAITCLFSILAFCVLRFVSDSMVAFVLLVVCTVGMASIGMAEFVKYAVAEACFDEERRPKQVARTITGAAIVAIVGPFTASATAGINEDKPLHGFAYFFLIMGGLAFLAIIVSAAMRLPSFQFKGSSDTDGASLCKILQRTEVWTAIALQSLIQILMVTPMQAAPLAMTNYVGLSVQSFWISGCVAAHIVARFLPGLFTGHLISAVGKMTVLTIGVVLLLSCSLLTLVGKELWNYYSGLTLLGIGWNFSFVSSTMILLASHSAEERTKVSSFNETFRFACNAFGAIASSGLAWDMICFSAFATIGVLSVLIGYMACRNFKVRATTTA